MVVMTRDGDKKVRVLKDRTARSIRHGDYLRVKPDENGPWVLCRVTRVEGIQLNRFSGYYGGPRNLRPAALHSALSRLRSVLRSRLALLPRRVGDGVPPDIARSPRL